MSNVIPLGKYRKPEPAKSDGKIGVIFIPLVFPNDVADALINRFIIIGGTGTVPDRNDVKGVSIPIAYFAEDSDLAMKSLNGDQAAGFKLAEKYGNSPELKEYMKQLISPEHLPSA